MGRRTTKGAKLLSVEISDEKKSELVDRAKREGRTIRGLLERIIDYYFANVPEDTPPPPKKRDA